MVRHGFKNRYERYVFKREWIHAHNVIIVLGLMSYLHNWGELYDQYENLDFGKEHEIHMISENYWEACLRP